MPELPEVQTIVNDLKRKLVGKTISGFWTDWPKVVKMPSARTLKSRIKGSKVEDVERRGKNVLIHLAGGNTLLIHQKMTGHLMVGKWQARRRSTGWEVVSLVKGPLRDRVNQFIHALFYFGDGEMLALSDLRKFGRIAFGTREQILNLPDIKMLGPDPMDPRFTLQKFRAQINRRRKIIKQALMDLSVVAGIGNIYADDILWSAKIHPLRPANQLTKRETETLFREMKKVLKRGIKMRGASVGDYRDTAGKVGQYGRVILVYRRTGKPCRRCGTPIKRIKIGQRSAHFCPHCQKERA